jgi:hypothetical protein
LVRIPHAVSEAGVYTVHPAPFCSLSCAKAHLVEHAVENSIQLRLLHRVARDIYAWHGEVLPTAPSRICLAAFGGGMSIEEFRSTTVTARARAPPFVPLRVMTEHTPLLRPEQQPTDHVMPTTQNLTHNAVWDVHNLRRPVRPVVLPRETNQEKSLLEHYVQNKQDGTHWEPSQYNANSNTVTSQNNTVTSQTPSLQEVTRAQENMQHSPTHGPSTLAPPPEEKKRRSRRRRYGGDTNATNNQSQFDLSAFIEDD